MDHQNTFNVNTSSGELDQSVKTILLRLAQLAQKKFSVRLEFHFPGENKVDENWVFSKLKNAQYLVFNEESYFPMHIQKEIVGVVQAHGSLTEKQAKKLMVMIDLVASSTLQLAFDLSSLEALEDKLQLVEPEKNVIRMDRYQQQQSKLLQLLNHPSPKQQPKKIAKCHFIHHSNENHRYKTSFDTHERSDNFAFLRINDLHSSALQSTEMFLQLGSMSLYVPEVTELQAPQQKFFADYLNCNESNGPTLFFGSYFPLLDSKMAFLVEPSLLLALQKALYDSSTESRFH